MTFDFPVTSVTSKDTNVMANDRELLPKNWDMKIRYSCHLDWEGFPDRLKGFFTGDPFMQCNMSALVEVLSDPATGHQYLSARTNLGCGFFLGEFTGHVICTKKADILETTSNGPTVFLYEDKLTQRSYFVDTSTSGNSTRFIRKVHPSHCNLVQYENQQDRPPDDSNEPSEGSDEPNEDETDAGEVLEHDHIEDNELREDEDKVTPNVIFRRIWLDGQVRIFVEVIKPVPQYGEIIASDENYTNDESLVQRMQSISLDGPFYTSFVTNPHYHHVDSLVMDRLTTEERRVLEKKKNLSEVGEVKYVAEKGHPCFGERGFFAARDIKKGEFIGEYTGRVLYTENALYDTMYQVDFTLDEMENEKAWVDASLVGNETRYMNDAMNTGHPVNATFRMMWVKGDLKVLAQATRDINEDEEILVEYGHGYWDNV